jgi:phthalate 4,5-cis-dihydrodiol dehydrogenase
VNAPLRLGVAGLGRGFMLMLPTFLRDARVRLVAAADPRPEARARFVQDFGGTAYADVAAMCADPQVEAVYVATPHQHHLDHVRLAAACGRHVMVEKPMALSLAACQAMIEACRQAGVQLLVGHSHSFDAPVLRARAMIASGAYGRLGMITAVNFTDFLYRPRRPEELDTAQGGGVVFSQAAHQIDIVRLLGGGLVRSVRAVTGAWDPARPTESAYSALLTFADGAFATLTYSGHAHFDTDEFQGWVGELGQERDAAAYGMARAALAKLPSPQAEAAFKATRAYGLAPAPAPDTAPAHHNHFGLLIASCAGADLRPMPDGVMVYGHAERRLERLPPPEVPRAEVTDELLAACRDGVAPRHSGAWGMATLEVCLALLDSARTGAEIALHHQCASAD